MGGHDAAIGGAQPVVGVGSADALTHGLFFVLELYTVFVLFGLLTAAAASSLTRWV